MPLKPGIENLILEKNLPLQKRAFLKKNVLLLKRRKTSDSAAKVIWIESCFFRQECLY